MPLPSKEKNKKGLNTMLALLNLLTPAKGEALYNLYLGLSITMILLMLVAAAAIVVMIMLQPSNSTGIDALGGSSETFFGKNKGKSSEERLKRWTWISLAILVVFSITFYILQLEGIWA